MLAHILYEVGEIVQRNFSNNANYVIIIHYKGVVPSTRINNE